ncbi:hypothetical protein AM501_20615 [Aneurinibacillus migulanus]|uniref:DNA modification system-associated small protein n=1 Tax=Aneurinibacillus migulanus TaxID=47500 RepID=UPI0005B97C67|nr:DNA modification system-associated small protein [Aneurinibacillus migulanus]KIV56077.1 hypothetical protein TS64_11405 [Aneurinibacillus migulanus]KPD06601.1 hypothetical protein AM501_20615 [Aneurinibacillus migulanus]
MNKLKKKKLDILEKICNENELPMKMVQQLLKSAEKFSYENVSLNTRKKEYTDLIDFYTKSSKGDQ